MYKGTVQKFLTEKGFGFIDSGGASFFFHHSELPGEGYKSIEPGTAVVFQVGPDPFKAGRECATDIELDESEGVTDNG